MRSVACSASSTSDYMVAIELREIILEHGVFIKCMVTWLQGPISSIT